MWHTLFLAWSLPFWLVLLAECCFLFWCVSYRRSTFAVISLVLLLVGFQFFTDIPVFVWMYENWQYTLGIIAFWLVASAPWAITKWWLFVRDNSYRYNEILANYLEANSDLPKDPNQWTLEQKVAWKEYFDRNSYQDDSYEYTKVEFYPVARQHKADIMMWMVFWPWSMAWTLLNDPIKKFFTHLYYWMVGWLESITAYYWADKKGHMPSEKELQQHYTALQAKRDEDYRRSEEERKKRVAEMEAMKQGS